MKRTLGTLARLLFMAVSAAVLSQVIADDAFAVNAVVKTDPAAKSYVVGQASEPLDISIRVDSVANLGGFELTLTWDPNRLVPIDGTPSQVLSIGPFLGSTGRSPTCLRDLTVPGRAWILCYTLGASPDGPTGGGVIAVMRFKAPVTSTQGWSLLSFSEVQLADITGASIGVTSQNGLVAVVPCSDVTGEGAVNIFDMAVVAAHFGQTSASPGWLPAADVTDDNVVNIFDLSAVAAAFGLTCP